MIKTINNVIKIPQGETGTVVFYIKQDTTDFPFILGPLPDYENDSIANLKAAFRFEVKSTNIVGEKGVLRADLDVTSDGDDEDNWHRFSTTEIKEYPDSVQDLEENVLYKQTVGDTTHFVWYNDTSEDPIEYDYPNSSITIGFQRDDTINLLRKSYFYEISYIIGTDLGAENEHIFFKQILLKDGSFIVEGGII